LNAGLTGGVSTNTRERQSKFFELSGQTFAQHIKPISFLQNANAHPLRRWPDFPRSASGDTYC